MASTRVDPVVQMLQLHPQNCTLNTVHSIVEPFHRMFVASPLSPRTEQPHGVCVGAVVRNGGAAFAECSQVLGGIEAEAPDIAQRPDTPAVMLCAVCLTRVFNHNETMATSNGDNVGHRCRL